MFLQNNPHITDVEFVQKTEENDVSEEILISNNMKISSEYTECCSLHSSLSKEQIAEVIDHRNIWFKIHQSGAPALVSDAECVFSKRYKDEVCYNIAPNCEFILLSSSQGKVSYVTNPKICHEFMSTNLLENITPIGVFLSRVLKIFNYNFYNVVDVSASKLLNSERKHKFKYYVLTSSNFDALLRHTDKNYSNMDKKDMIVVVNTKDDDYKERVSSWCEDEGIEYHITKSNGTPARGKNTVIDLFLKSDNDYMVLVDGDDFLTPHGIWLYDYLSKQDSPPDAVCLKHQISTIVDYHKVQKKRSEDNNYNHRDLPLEEIPTRNVMYFTSDWDRIESESIYPSLIKYGCSEKDAKKFSKWHKEFYRLQKKYCEDNEAHCRITWMSKDVLSRHKFPENLVVGEDTVFYFNVKKDGLDGKLDIRCNDERPATYVYDQRTPGTVHNEVKEGTDWSWMGLYNEEVYSLERKGVVVEDRDLPLLKIDYPEEYIPDNLLIGDIGSFEFNQETGDSGNMYMPSNSSDNTLQKNYNLVYGFYK